jgi:hypothetical protein
MKRQTKMEAVFVAVCAVIAGMIAWKFYEWIGI